jgi:hypothetical protein
MWTSSLVNKLIIEIDTHFQLLTFIGAKTEEIIKSYQITFCVADYHSFFSAK